MMDYDARQTITSRYDSAEIDAIRTRQQSKDNKKQSKIKCIICNKQRLIVSQCQYNSYKKKFT